MIRPLVIWLALIGAVLLGIAALKSNGATEHPLLVDAATPNHAEPNRWLSPCPIGKSNLPTRSNKEIV